jgi:hypothetical protein
VKKRMQGIDSGVRLVELLDTQLGSELKAYYEGHSQGVKETSYSFFAVKIAAS